MALHAFRPKLLECLKEYDRHDPNQELMAQGVANFVAPFFGGMPATGTIARTSANVRSGARTPVSGIVHALTLLAIVLLAAPLAGHVPLAALAAILLFVAWNMGDWGEFARLKQFSVQYRTIMVATFLLTVVVDLTVAVQIGLVLILDLHMVINLDSTCLDTLEGLHRSLRKRGALLVLCDANEHPLSLMRRSGFIEKLGAENLLPDLPAAIDRAGDLLKLRQA